MGDTGKSVRGYDKKLAQGKPEEISTIQTTLTYIGNVFVIRGREIIRKIPTYEKQQQEQKDQSTYIFCSMTNNAIFLLLLLFLFLLLLCNFVVATTTKLYMKHKNRNKNINVHTSSDQLSITQSFVVLVVTV